LSPGRRLSIGTWAPVASVIMVPRAKETHIRSDSRVSSGAVSIFSRV